MKGLTAITYHPYGHHYPYHYDVNRPMYFYGGQPSFTPYTNYPAISLVDYGPAPFVVDLDAAAKQNSAYRTALWTGPYLQLTLMSLNVGEDIGLEMHADLDQFLRVEQGRGIIQLGNQSNYLNIQREIVDGTAIIIPAGTWHNLINTGNMPLKLTSIYAPPAHPHGTVHATRAEGIEAEEGYGH